jgi:hypothetical protein
MCCIHVFCFVKWSECVKKVELWDLCGSEDFEQRGQWAQESEIRTIYTPENLKPFYDGGGFFVRF